MILPINSRISTIILIFKNRVRKVGLYLQKNIYMRVNIAFISILSISIFKLSFYNFSTFYFVFISFIPILFLEKWFRENKIKNLFFLF